MTTLIGIVSEDKFKEGSKRSVTLASDKAGTKTTWNPEGDVAYKLQERSESQKIFLDDNGEFALCMTGTFDSIYQDFQYALLRGKVGIKKALNDGHFPELLKLNLSRWGGKLPQDNLNALLIATRFDNKPRLFTCYPLGKVEERLWTSIGSGSKYASEHIEKSEKIIPYELSLEEGIDLSVEGIKAASKDVYTGGLDIVAVTDKQILQFGKSIDEKVNGAHNRAITDIKKGLKKGYYK